ncbi:MAG: hypothetical protein RLZZ528_2362 [Pseudomonadota bacterium]|jgi:nucleotide-binding universal stress UspA family protein
MAYKSILTIFTGSAPDMTVLDAAVSLARREDAHLDVLCIGIDRSDPGFYFAGATAAVFEATFEQARTDSTACETAVRTRLASEDIRWATDKAAAQLGLVASVAGMRARYADLVLAGSPYAEAAPSAAEAALEGALFDGRAPVLVVPGKGLDARFADRILAAWNEDAEAMTAIRAALSLLKAAHFVDVAVVDPSARSSERSDPGGALSQMLARHGVRAEVSVLARTQPRVADVLLRHVRDTGAGLVVMGAYGHSRFREAIIGGATRHMLEQTEVPVLLAH